MLPAVLALQHVPRAKRLAHIHAASMFTVGSALSPVAYCQRDVFRCSVCRHWQVQRQLQPQFCTLGSHCLAACAGLLY